MPYKQFNVDFIKCKNALKISELVKKAIEFIKRKLVHDKNYIFESVKD